MILKKANIRTCKNFVLHRVPNLSLHKESSPTTDKTKVTFSEKYQARIKIKRESLNYLPAKDDSMARAMAKATEVPGEIILLAH